MEFEVLSIQSNEIPELLNRLKDDFGLDMDDDIVHHTLALGSARNLEPDRLYGDVDLISPYPKDVLWNKLTRLKNPTEITRLTYHHFWKNNQVISVYIGIWSWFNLKQKPIIGNIIKKGYMNSTFYNEGTVSNHKYVFQVDFMFGDPQILRLFYHSPKKSAFKGLHRNLLLMAVARNTILESSNELDSHGRPISIINYKFSPTLGLVKVKRESIMGKNDEHLIKQNVTTLEQYKTPEEVCRILSLDSIDSFESIGKSIAEWPNGMAILNEYEESLKEFE